MPLGETKLGLGKKKKTTQDYISDNILKEFLKQLPWQKDQLIGIAKTYLDVIKIDDIVKTDIKIGKGFMSGKFFAQFFYDHLPNFEFENKKYRFHLSNFYRESIPPRKFISKFPGFHVRKMLAEVKEAV